MGISGVGSSMWQIFVEGLAIDNDNDRGEEGTVTEVTWGGTSTRSGSVDKDEGGIPCTGWAKSAGERGPEMTSDSRG
jgi:hypothetical protein